MSDSSITLAIAGLALIILALGYGLSTIQDHGRRMTALENERAELVEERMDVQMATRKLTGEMVSQQRRIEQLEARPEPKPHSTVALAQSNVAEAALIEAGK